MTWFTKAVQGKLIADYGLHLSSRDLIYLTQKANMRLHSDNSSDIAFMVACAWQRGERAVK